MRKLNARRGERKALQVIRGRRGYPTARAERLVKKIKKVVWKQTVKPLLFPAWLDNC